MTIKDTIRLLLIQTHEFLRFLYRSCRTVVSLLKKRKRCTNLHGCNYVALCIVCACVFLRDDSLPPRWAATTCAMYDDAMQQMKR